MNHFSEENKQRLAELLDARAEQGASMRLDEAQAYLLALISGPDEIDWEACLEEVLAEGEFGAAEQDEILSLLQKLADGMRECLRAKTLPELYFYRDENGETDYFTWCNAYLFALDTVETDWFERANNEEFEDTFYPLMALAGIYDEDENGNALFELKEKEIKQLQADLPASVLDIALFWQATLNKPQTVKREGDKVGRNDPCPCQSGKKYKACCGKN